MEPSEGKIAVLLFTCNFGGVSLWFLGAMMMKNVQQPTVVDMEGVMYINNCMRRLCLCEFLNMHHELVIAIGPTR